MAGDVQKCRRSTSCEHGSRTTRRDRNIAGFATWEWSLQVKRNDCREASPTSSASRITKRISGGSVDCTVVSLPDECSARAATRHTRLDGIEQTGKEDLRTRYNSVHTTVETLRSRMPRRGGDNKAHRRLCHNSYSCGPVGSGRIPSIAGPNLISISETAINVY